MSRDYNTVLSLPLLPQWLIGLSIGKPDKNQQINLDLTDPIQRFVSVVYQVIMIN